LDEHAKIKIGHEISRIDKSLDSVKPLLDLCKLREPDVIEMTAAAQVLHSFCNGVESIVALIFKNMNENLPNDFKWHKTLFEMAFGENSKNIKIFRAEIKLRLEKYLLFRHFIRHSYGSELRWGEMEPLVKNLEEVWEMLKTDFGEFMHKN